jgi:choline kinase
MKAIILAAGKGTRLNGVDLKPKCLFEVGGQTLLDRQVSILRSLPVDEIVVVVGFEAERIRSAASDELSFVFNRRFEETSSLYSLWLARDHLLDGFIVLNCDVLFHPELLTKLVASSHDNALLADFSNRVHPCLGEEEMKVKVMDGLVVDIRKSMDPSEADGENVGMVKFSREGASRLVEVMDRLIAQGLEREWAPRAFLDFAARFPLHAISTEDYPWIEIDFPDDYRRATEEVFPQINSMISAGRI